MDERLKKVKFFVEANSFERHQLWRDFHEKIDWKQDLSGVSILIGQIKPARKPARPIYVDFSFATLNGKLICFYNGCSALVDHTMIEEWLEKEYPVKYDSGSRRAMCDAMNFHHCFHFCKE